MEDLERLKYPIGVFMAKEHYSKEDLSALIHVIKTFPDKLQSTVTPLKAEQLQKPYRPGGWTVIQLVNHCADSHMNALIRVKLALTEDSPVIKPYLQDLWVNLPDGSLPAETALMILKGVHHRWTVILQALTGPDWERGFFHPEKGKLLSLKEATASYAWHCEHHLAHIRHLIDREGWKF